MLVREVLKMIGLIFGCDLVMHEDSELKNGEVELLNEKL
jgi:hypothetical protein